MMHLVMGVVWLFLGLYSMFAKNDNTLALLCFILSNQCRTDHDLEKIKEKLK